jgi:hypothetical protein
MPPRSPFPMFSSSSESRVARDVPLPLALRLWGLLGLLLAMPLAVCLVVLGHHIRGLEFFECCSATSLRSPRHKALR